MRPQRHTWHVDVPPVSTQTAHPFDWLSCLNLNANCVRGEHFQYHSTPPPTSACNLHTTHKLQINGCVPPGAELLFKYRLGSLNTSQVRTPGHPIKQQISGTWLTIHFVIFSLPLCNHVWMTFKIKPEEKNKFPEVKQACSQSAAQ